MATQKEVKNRIASIKNINKITRAMEMVAAARLRRSEQRIDAPAALRGGDAQADPAAPPSRPVACRASRCWTSATNVERVGIVLITGDRGLAGAFNTNIIREGMRIGDRVREEGAEPRFSVVGRKGVSALTFRKQDVRTAPTSASPTGPPSPTRARSARS